MLLLPRRFRIVSSSSSPRGRFGVILTANYTFLNYLVLSLGFLLLDDRFLRPFVPARARNVIPRSLEARQENAEQNTTTNEDLQEDSAQHRRADFGQRIHSHLSAIRLAIAAVMLTWIFYNTTAEMLLIPFRSLPLPTKPIALLDPFRIANQYGLFAVMTNGRYEIEFQGSTTGRTGRPISSATNLNPERGSPHLRAVPAALRLESLVRLAWRLAAKRNRPAN